MSGLIINPTPHKPVVRVEVCRSFAYTLNVSVYGGPQYENRSFFASEKAECAIEDSIEVSAALYAFCKSQVLMAVKEYISEMRTQQRKTA